MYSNTCNEHSVIYLCFKVLHRMDGTLCILHIDLMEDQNTFTKMEIIVDRDDQNEGNDGSSNADSDSYSSAIAGEDSPFTEQGNQQLMTLHICASLIYFTGGDIACF